MTKQISVVFEVFQQFLKLDLEQMAMRQTRHVFRNKMIDGFLIGPIIAVERITFYVGILSFPSIANIFATFQFFYSEVSLSHQYSFTGAITNSLS